MSRSTFHFKQFSISDDDCAMKVGTDGVLLGAWSKTDDAMSILDVGTGSGLIALMLAQRSPNALITAVEIDPPAAKEAEQNFMNSPWKDRIYIVNASIQDFEKTNQSQFDLIVCNPPFFPVMHYISASGRSREYARNDTTLPLKELFEIAGRLLAPTGKLDIIIPTDQNKTALIYASDAGLHPCQITSVFPKAEKECHRVLMRFSRSNSKLLEDELIIQKSPKRNDYSDDYIALTQDFHTIF